MEAKTRVLAAVASRQGTAFRNGHIVDETGLSKQLVGYHLDRLVDTGYVQKEGPVYVCVNMPGLINLLAQNGESKQKKVWPTKIYPKQYVNHLNDAIMYASFGRAMKLPGWEELRMAIISDIDSTLNSIKAGRKSLVNNQTTKNAWRRKMRDLTEDEIVREYHTWLTHFLENHTIRKGEVETAVVDAMEETDE